MVDIYYPADLPEPLGNTRESVDFGVVRTRMDNGKLKVRKRFVSARHLVDLRFLLSPAERLKWETFYQTQGLDWFYMPFQRQTDNYAIIRFIADYTITQQSGVLYNISVKSEFNDLVYIKPNL